MPEYFSHPSAVLDDGCLIGAGSKIWHFSHIMSGSSIGKNCNIGQNVFVAPGVSLGNNVKIQNNVSLYTGVNCEDNVFIGPSVVFTNIKNPRSSVERKDQYLETSIGTGATIGANSTILCGLQIGRFAFIGAGSVLTKNVEDYAMVYGNPAVQSGWMSEYGQKLDFDESGIAVCKESGQKYQKIKEKVQRIL